MRTDFASYGWDDSDVHEIMEGAEKNTDKSLVICTYQSIYKQDKKWFDQFGVVIGDEAHLFKAKTLVNIMTKMKGCRYRFGFTGTLDGTECNAETLEGLFGPVFVAATTSELIDDGYLSKLRINCVVLKHPQEAAMQVYDYHSEMEYLVSCERRNNYLRNLVLELKGNTLLLFQYVEKHGKILDEIIREAAALGRPVYYVHGGVKTETREEIRGQIENDDWAIYIASYGTLSTGVNIPKLHNLVFASPSKSRIRNLQSLGRILRLHGTKDISTLYDIADDMTYGGEMNYTLRHFIERIRIYNEQDFDYRIFSVNIGES
jgi:superfamily II DNA or RNA helicase